ncbi:MAG: 16S rRNA (guanine(966)-N(2))-methyltransferase RsmD [Hyphomicrobiaceae bacterium]
MRIVAGRLKGRPIAAREGSATRPTSDRVREAVFNILEHGIDGFEIRGARVIDMFAGTGALGLEALSRGAAYALFVEIEAEARALVRENTITLGLGGVTRILKRDAVALGRYASRAEFTLAFLDPPYGKGLAERALVELRDGGWLVDGAIVVIEEGATSPVALPSGFENLDRRTYGGTEVTFARYAPAVDALAQESGAGA